MLAIVALIASIAGAQAPASAEKPYALLFGTVWTADHRPLSGVPIHIRRAEDKKAKWTLVSDGRGEFAQRVPAGKEDYVVWADLKGKNGGKVLETKVHVDNDERVDFGLHLTE
ncbi:MAG: hypothetical protein ACXVZV_00935 [Terriglobales bacterium]